MTFQEYIQLACRTESHIECFEVDPRIWHAAVGIATESGELLDALKKTEFYGKQLDRVNLREELGDLLWYIAVMCDALGADPSEIMAKNIEKLKKRYPEKFSNENALNRDLAAEREILE